MRQLLFILGIIACHFSYGQVEASTALKTHRILYVFEDNHLIGKTLDLNFATTIQHNFLRASDPYKLVFKAKDIETLEQSLPLLVEDLKNDSTAYFTLASKIWKKNIAAASTLKDQYFEALEQSVIENNLPSGLLKSKDVDETFSKEWETIFRSSILNNVAEIAKGYNFVMPGDSITPWIKSAISTSSSRYTDYFKGLSEDEKFLENVYLNAIASAYDPHSSYFTAGQYNEFREELSSERKVFGISYNKTIHGAIEITAILPGSPAWLSGEIHVGDIIKKIKMGDEHPIDVSGKTIREVSNLFRESESDELTLFIESKGREKTVNLTRAEVYSDSDVIKTALLEGEHKVGYISLPDFYTNWNDYNGLGCANDLAKSIIKLKKEGIEGVILDLRDNGGGSLKEAIDLTGIFINYGPVLVVNDRDGTIESLKDFNRGAIYSGPLIVLINEYSASASEVVAGALQDYNRAVIVGNRSFGKATGQGILPLAPTYEMKGDQADSYGFVKLTGAGLYRIDLSTNQINGVQPDVQLTTFFEEDIQREGDYDNAITLDSISKKMYYTPAAPFELESIRIASQERQSNNAYLTLLSSISDSIVAQNSERDAYTISLSEFLAAEQKTNALLERLESAAEPTTVFEARAMAYDAEVYRMNAYLNNYKEQFLERTLSDWELIESFHIMQDLIQSKQSQ